VPEISPSTVDEDLKRPGRLMNTVSPVSLLIASPKNWVLTVLEIVRLDSNLSRILFDSVAWVLLAKLLGMSGPLLIIQM
jgi:hypothetical protein